MASRAALDAYVATNGDIRTLLLDDLEAIAGDIKPEDSLASVLRRLDEAVPGLVDLYGEMAAATAADFYDELRAAAGPVQRFHAVMAGPVPADAIRSAVRSTMREWGAPGVEPSQVLDNTIGMTEEITLKRGRRTLVKNIARDTVKPMWARVPSGSTTCAWCLMLASRGAAYHSLDAARHSHRKCDCVITPFWTGDKLPKGYDPEALAEQWDAAAAQVEKDNPRIRNQPRTKAILAQLREDHGLD